MSVELLQEQVELYLEYDDGSLRKWNNFRGRALRDFFKSVSLDGTVCVWI